MVVMIMELCLHFVFQLYPAREILCGAKLGAGEEGSRVVGGAVGRQVGADGVDAGVDAVQVPLAVVKGMQEVCGRVVGELPGAPIGVEPDGVVDELLCLGRVAVAAPARAGVSREGHAFRSNDARDDWRPVLPGIDDLPLEAWRAKRVARGVCEVVRESGRAHGEGTAEVSTHQHRTGGAQKAADNPP